MNNTPLRSVAHTAAAAVTICLIAAATHAANATWDGGDASSPNWGKDDNWTGNTAPDTADTVRFGDGYPSGGFGSGTPNLSGNRTALEMRINHTGSRDILTTSTDTLTLTNGDLNRNASSTGNQTLGSTIELGDTGDWDIKGAGSLTLDARITGPHPLNKTGEASLIFAGSTANDYTGLTTVSGGTLRLDKSPGTDAIPTDLTINASAEVELLAANQINNAATLTLNGGDLRLNGHNETFNAANLQSGLLHLDNADLTLDQITHTGPAQLHLGNAATNTLTLESGTLTSPIDGDGTILKSGSDTLEFTTANANGLTLQINNGTVQTNSTTANLFTNTITINNSGTLQLDDDTDHTLTAPLNGGGTLHKTGVGALTFDVSPVSNLNVRIDNGTFVVSAIDANQFKSPITVNAPGTLQLDDAFDTTFFKELAGTGNLLKSNAFTTLLGNGDPDPNTHTGLTTVNDGELHLNKANNTNAFGGDLLVNGSGSVLLLANHQIPDTATVTVDGSGTFNANNHTETIHTLNLNDGQFRLATNTVTTSDKDFTLTTINDTGNATIFLGSSASNTLTVHDGNIDSTVSGNGTLRKQGPGTLDFTANVAASSTNLKLKIAEGTFATTVNRLNKFTTIQGINGTLSISGSGTISEQLTGTGGQLIKTGPGTLTIAGPNPNTYTGQTTIEDGTLIFNKTSTNAVSADVHVGDDTGAPNSATLQLNADNQINDNANLNILSDGHFDMNGHADSVRQLTGTGTVTLGTTLTIDATGSFQFNGTLQGTGGIHANQNNTFTLGGATPNTYTGLTEVNDGTLQLNKPDGTDALAGDIQINNQGSTLKLLQSNNIPDTTDITIADITTFDLAGQTETINNLTGPLNAVVTLGHLTVGADNGSSTYQGFFTGTGSLTKTGAGTLTLDRAIANDTIDLIIDNGTVAVSAPGIELFNSPITINAGATLDLDSNQKSNPTLDDTLTRELTGPGNLTKSGPAKTRIGINDSAPNTNTGRTTLNAGTLEFNKSGGTDAIGGDLLINDGTALFNRNNQLPDTSTVTLDGGALDLNGKSETITLLQLNAPAVANLNGGNLTAAVNGDGTLTGSGAVTGDTDLDGAVAPGASPGVITFDGNLTLGPNATLNIELAGADGPGSPTGHDQLAVTANATLNGTLHITTLNSFDENIIPTDEFTILTFATNNANTAFGSLTLDAPSIPGLSLTPTYHATSLTLTATATPGDANLDGSVTLEDLVILAANFDSTVGQRAWRQADFNLDTFVNATDLQLAAPNFQGNPDTLLSLATSLGVHLTQTPEPATAAILLSLALATRPTPSRRRHA